MIGQKFWLIPAAFAAVVLSGCKPEEEIRTYTVEKETERTVPTKAEQVTVGDAKFRLLGAIIPAEKGYSWFVRFYGPIDQVSPLEEDFNKFLTSIRPSADGSKPLTWTTPPGWTVGPAKQMRMVTLQKGAAEIYISDPIGGSILDNINSWRFDIVGIPKVTQTELANVTAELMLGTTKAMRVDFRGPGGKGRMGGVPLSGKN